jgi:hypothetical protein
MLAALSLGPINGAQAGGAKLAKLRLPQVTRAAVQRQPTGCFTPGSFERPEGLGPAEHSKVFAGKGLTRRPRKKGSYSDPGNHRGNTIIPAIDKLFAS